MVLVQLNFYLQRGTTSTTTHHRNNGTISISSNTNIANITSNISRKTSIMINTTHNNYNATNTDTTTTTHNEATYNYLCCSLYYDE